MNKRCLRPLTLSKESISSPAVIAVYWDCRPGVTQPDCSCVCFGFLKELASLAL